MICPKCRSSNGKPYMALDNETKQLVYNPRIRICKDCGHQDMLYKFFEVDSGEEDDEEMMPPPAPRRQGTIKVNLIYKGRGNPPVVECDEGYIGTTEFNTETFTYEGEQPLISKKMFWLVIAVLVISIVVMTVF